MVIINIITIIIIIITIIIIDIINTVTWPRLCIYRCCKNMPRDEVQIVGS